MSGLQIKKTYQGHYYIDLDGETVHSGLYSLESANSFMNSYQKIYDAGVLKGKSEK